MNFDDIMKLNEQYGEGLKEISDSLTMRVIGGGWYIDEDDDQPYYKFYVEEGSYISSPSTVTKDGLPVKYEYGRVGRM